MSVRVNWGALIEIVRICALVICFTAIDRMGFTIVFAETARGQTSSSSRIGQAQPRTLPLRRAPVVQVIRDDRVVTLEMDYNARSPHGQFWTMSGSLDDDAGFLVIWWPETTSQTELTFPPEFAREALCISSPPLIINASIRIAATPTALTKLPVGARWMVTGNRRVQLQPLDNERAYRVRVQRLSAGGRISSRATELSFNGGGGGRGAGLRPSLT